MEFVVIDVTPAQRAALLGRVQEAIRLAGLSQVTVSEVDPLSLDAISWDGVLGCFVGSGTGAVVKEILAKINSARSECPIALVLDSETYLTEAVKIHKLVGHTVVAETDLIQISNWILDAERKSSGRQLGNKQRRVIAVTQMKGGVGASTVVSSLAALFASQEKSVAIVDLDEVTCNLTEWSMVPQSNRTVVSELVRGAAQFSECLRDALYRPEAYKGGVAVFPQPSMFQEGLHVKAPVLNGAPQGSDFIQHLFPLLIGEFDIVLVDCSKSWGIATLATLGWCEKIVLLIDEEPLSLQSTFQSLARLRDESGDVDEFNFTKWSLVLNKFTGKKTSMKEILAWASEADLFTSDSKIFALGFSNQATKASGPGESLYERADSKLKKEFVTLADFLAGTAKEVQAR